MGIIVFIIGVYAGFMLKKYEYQRKNKDCPHDEIDVICKKCGRSVI